ncbi:DUF1735 and LamG domain-containing protein [Terrimonas rubra]|uniref:DUF1735 and LamG domain-containing protein n=1 Tax=Terrimonas rubra TaxID=1035890 RepID=A0ABW6A899_9BACT
MILITHTTNLYNRWGILLAVVLFGWGCTKNDINNTGIFISDPDLTGNNIRNMSVDQNGGSYRLTASASILAEADIPLSFEVDTALVDAYNQKWGTAYKPLPPRFYSLSSTTSVIRKGSSISDSVNILVKPLDNSVSDGDLFMIPVTVNPRAGNISAIAASRVAYVIINRVLINPALDVSRISNLAFDIPDPIKNLTAFTAEFRVKVTNSFYNNMTLFSAYPSEIYSRFGDVVIKPNQLQIKYAGIQPASLTEFTSNRWYHIAYVLDGAAGTFKIYVDGRLDATTPTPGNVSFNLESMFFGGSGRHPMHVQELRFWTKARTQAEIAGSFCAVNPAAPGLYGYWKFNDGQGNTVADATTKGHTGRFTGTNAWVQGIRCPE